MNKHAEFEEKDSCIDILCNDRNTERLLYRIADE